MRKSNHKNQSKPTSKGPPRFSEFGQKAKDLLTSGYSKSQKFSFSTHSDGGVNITSSSTAAKKGGRSTAAVAGEYAYKNTTFSCRIDTDSKITGTLTLNEKFLSSTNTITAFSLPDYQSSKLWVRIRQEYAALSTSVALNKSPELTFSAAVGSSSIALGMETEYKTDSSCFPKCSAGIHMKSLNSDASIILANKGDLLTASCVLYVDKEKKNAAVVEFTQKLSTKRNTLTVGGSYAVDHQTVVKARLDDHGEFKTVLQYNVRPKSCLAISGEFNTKALDKIPKIGLALSLVL